MTLIDIETGGRFGTVLDTVTYNKIGGASFALWGLIHVIVGGIGLAIFFTGGTDPILEFVTSTPL